MQSLTDADDRCLAKSWIPPELAAAAGIFRVDTFQGAELVGKKPGSGNFAGLVFPYRSPLDDSVSLSRLRRDQPDLSWENGRLREKNKYLSPPGRQNKIYYPPGTSAAWLTDANVPVFLTEGEKKTLALRRYCDLKGKPRLVMGLAGVWSWRTKVGRKPGPGYGEWEDVTGPLPEFDRLAWLNRHVVLLFDANVRTNPEVNRARVELAKELTGRGALVRFVDVPEISGINGVDDFLAAFGPQALGKCLASAEIYRDPVREAAAANAFFKAAVAAARQRARQTGPLNPATASTAA